MNAGRRRHRGAVGVVAGMLVLHCASPRSIAPGPPAVSAPRVEEKAVTLERLLSRPADLILTIHPPAVARDGVYGPLLRRASELASAYAGPTNLGTTALAVLAQTDAVVVAENDRGREAVVVLRGVPANLDPLDVVDTAGKPLWRPVRGDVRTGARELEPAEPADAALFITPGLVWVVASGPAIARARAVLLGGAGKEEFAGDETPLISLSLPGAALPQLRQGSLESVGAHLLRVKVELSPGSQGLVVVTLAYPDASSAASAEGTVLAVTLAFRHRLENDIQATDVARAPGRTTRDEKRSAEGLNWLGAAKVERSGTDVLVRAPIPRPWLDALRRAEVPAPSP